MAATLTIENFQSIGKTELEIEGFTVITGPNNAGKSAVVRAILGMFTNNTGPKHSWVRNGEKSLKVSLSFGEETILWERGPKISRYEVNGVPINKVGKDLPAEVPAWGIRPLKVGKETLWPQIADQFLGQTFLTRESGSVLAEAIADVDRVGKLNRALRLGDSKRREAASQLKVRRKDADALSAKLHALEDLDPVQVQIELLEQKRTTAVQDARKIEYLKRLQSQLRHAEAEIQSLAGLEDIKLTNPSKAKRCQVLLQDLGVLKTRLRKAETAHSQYQGLGEVSLPSKDKAQKTALLLEGLRDLQQKLHTLQSTLDRLPSKFPDLGEGGEAALQAQRQCGSLWQLQGRLSQKTAEAEAAAKALSLKEKVLKKCLGKNWDDAEPLLEEGSILRALKVSLESKQRFLDETTQELAAKEAQLETLIHETHDTLKTLKECPTCGKST